MGREGRRREGRERGWRGEGRERGGNEEGKGRGGKGEGKGEGRERGGEKRGERRGGKEKARVKFDGYSLVYFSHCSLNILVNIPEHITQLPQPIANASTC